MNGLFITLLLVCCGTDVKDWIPPENPVPRIILREAQVDVREGRHAVALAKHIWYHQHATEHDDSAKLTRLGTALGPWVELGKVYPPALIKLKEFRDAAIERVKKGESLQQSFKDLAAINRRLRETDRTKDAFLWLHEHNKDAAKEVFKIAGSALTETGEYKLYGEYERPSVRRSKIIYFHQLQLRIADNDPKYSASRLRMAEDVLTHDASMLVACLVIAGREAEAKRTAELLKEQCDSRKYHESLEKALKGTVPRPLYATAKPK